MDVYTASNHCSSIFLNAIIQHHLVSCWLYIITIYPLTFITKKDGCIFSAYKRFCLRLHMSIYLFIFFISYKLLRKYTTHYGHERDCVFIVSNDGPILCEECTLYPSIMLKRFRRNVACLKSFQKYRNCFLMPIALPSLHFTLKF